MKRLVAVAAVVLGIAVPVCAQRVSSHGSSHGGFSGHAAPPFHGGGSAGPSRPIAGPARPAFATHVYRPGSGGGFAARSGYGGRGTNGGGRDGDGDRRHHRREYIPGYGIGYGYGIGPVLGWYGPGYLSYGDDLSGDDTQGAPPDAAAGGSGYGVPGENGSPDANGPQTPDGSDAPNGYGPVVPAPGLPAARPPYRPGAPMQQPAVGESEAVTLVFKDGRPPEQIRNYVLTPTTIYVSGRRDIALDQIDVAATEKVNREAGVDFHLPVVGN